MSRGCATGVYSVRPARGSNGMLRESINAPRYLSVSEPEHAASPLDRRRRIRHQSIGNDLSYYVDRIGRQHFNFPQRVWLNESVAMAYTLVYSAALETLAVNVLTWASRERNVRAARGMTSWRVIALASAFCEDCLLPAPEHAWALPRSSIKGWLSAQRSVPTLPAASFALRVG
jgi:hypothetical protein